MRLRAAICFCPMFVALLGASDATPPASDRILSELEAANRARATLAGEQSAWDSERAKLELLAQTLKTKIFTLNQQVDRNERDARNIEALLESSKALYIELANLEAAAATSAAAIHSRLDTLARTFPPGAVSSRLPGNPDGALEKVRVALLRLDQSERESADIRVEIVTGSLNDEERSVKLLRVGAAAMWWVALDASDEGIASMSDGRLQLIALEGYDIAEAIDIVEGRRPARIVELPVGHLFGGGR